MRIRPGMFAVLASFCIAAPGIALAQDHQPSPGDQTTQPPAGVPPDDPATPPTGPQAPGIIPPPRTGDNGAVKPPPAVPGDHMPVIPPPGSATGNQQVQPK